MVGNGYALRELDGELIRHHLDDRGFTRVETMEEANGVSFLCPKCFHVNGGAKGTHTILCTFRGGGALPIDQRGLGPIWEAVGTCLDDLTFVGPEQYSVQLLGGCSWHGFIRNGVATLS